MVTIHRPVPFLPRIGCLIALSTALLGVTACSPGDGGGQEEVAALPTPQGEKSAAAPSANTVEAPEADRPHIRLDTTDEEADAMYQAWHKCLKDNGGVVRTVPVEKSRKEGLLDADKSEQPAASLRACATKEPVTPPELDPQRNPDYLDDFRAWVNCVKDKGLAVTALPGAEGWNFDDSVSQDERASARTREIIDFCEVEAFK
jgi:hypothetical protein